MEFIDSNFGWLLFAYSLGTIVGWWFTYRSNAERIIEGTIDSLVEQGFIKLEGENFVKWEDWCKDERART